jgi:hypothetical protein
MPATPEAVTTETFATTDTGERRVLQDLVSCGLVGSLSPWDAASYARDLMNAAYTAARAAAEHGSPGWKKCRFCPTPILWAKTESGASFPLIPGATPDGNMAVRFEGDQVRVRKLKDGEQPGPGEQRGTSHFADCPGADQARKPRKSGDRAKDVTR